MRTPLVLLLVIGGILRGQDDPKDLLLRASHKVMETIDRLPRYVCTLTVDRVEYQINSGRNVHSCDDLAAHRKAGRLKADLVSSDRLRLDVAIGASNEAFGVSDEMYSWVGDSHFDDRGLFDLVRQGAVSTGSFASFLVSIFSGNVASFSYNGDATVDGRSLSEFGFRVPLEKSNFVYSFGADRSQRMRTAYDGTFFVDPKTVELVRLIVHSDLPPETGACESTQTLDYGRVNLGGADFLLATEARLNIWSLDNERANHSVYSACHEFVGQSTLTFAPPEPGQSVLDKSDSASGASALPPGLPFKLVFTEPIATASAAAGNPIKARLTTAIRTRSSGVLVPEGAIVTGRIVRARRQYGPNRSFLLAVRLESVSVGGASRPFHATRDSGLRRFPQVTRSLGQRVGLGALDTSQDRDAGVLEFRNAGPDYVIKGGLQSDWLTAAD